MNILLCITGSVAAKLAPKLVTALRQVGEVEVVVTEAAKHFYFEGDMQVAIHRTTQQSLIRSVIFAVARVNDDATEWNRWRHLSDLKNVNPVLHIALRDWADVIVVAPLTANTLAKIANGISDNLLTSVVRAWDYRKPMVLAPSMNTTMLKSHFTTLHLQSMTDLGAVCVPPTTKTLACGETGEGAMADIDDIVAAIKKQMVWQFPLATQFSNGIPCGKHPGAFGAVRKHDIHTGVDLYVRRDTPLTWDDLRCKTFVYAVEPGRVIGIIPFTGKELGHTWWRDTRAILIQGVSGVVCYGEILDCQITHDSGASFSKIKVGDFVAKGQLIACVEPVMEPDRIKPDVPGHSNCMLHLELYTAPCTQKETGDPLNRMIWRGWKHGTPQPEKLMDPTPYLLACKPDGVPILEIR